MGPAGWEQLEDPFAPWEIADSDVSAEGHGDD
jgi:hypothetical protein